MGKPKGPGGRFSDAFTSYGRDSNGVVQLLGDDVTDDMLDQLWDWCDGKLNDTNLVMAEWAADKPMQIFRRLIGFVTRLQVETGHVAGHRVQHRIVHPTELDAVIGFTSKSGYKPSLVLLEGDGSFTVRGVRAEDEIEFLRWHYELSCNWPGISAGREL